MVMEPRSERICRWCSTAVGGLRRRRSLGFPGGVRYCGDASHAVNKISRMFRTYFVPCFCCSVLKSPYTALMRFSLQAE